MEIIKLLIKANVDLDKHLVRLGSYQTHGNPLVNAQHSWDLWIYRDVDPRELWSFRGSDLSPLFLSACLLAQFEVRSSAFVCVNQATTTAKWQQFAPGWIWVSHAFTIGFLPGSMCVSAEIQIHHMASSVEQMMINSMIKNEKASNFGVANILKASSSLYVFMSAHAQLMACLIPLGFASSML